MNSLPLRRHCPHSDCPSKSTQTRARVIRHKQDKDSAVGTGTSYDVTYTHPIPGNRFRYGGALGSLKFSTTK